MLPDVVKAIVNVSIFFFIDETGEFGSLSTTLSSRHAATRLNLDIDNAVATAR